MPKTKKIKDPIIRPEFFSLICLSVLTCVAAITFTLNENKRMLDILLIILVVISAFSLIGNLMIKAGKYLEFGAVSGRYIHIASGAIGCTALLVSLFLVHNFSLDNVTWIHWSIGIVLLLLCILQIISFAIIEKLLRAQKSHREESQRLHDEKAQANTKATHDNFQALVFDNTFKKLRKTIAGQENLNGDELISLAYKLRRECSDELYKQMKDKQNKQTNKRASEQRRSTR